MSEHGNDLAKWADSHGLIKAIGHTPLVELCNIYEGSDFCLHAKLEGLNPGGSMKDRPSRCIIQQGIRTGLINSETVIVESSSGNMGIGLAQICAVYKLRFICVVDPKTTSQNINLLKVYGAEVDVVTQPDPQTGEYLQARINRVRGLLTSTPNSFWPNQYANPNNPLAHRETMHEIVTELGRPPDYLFIATSTCGTIRGCWEYLRAHNFDTKIIGVDAYGSVIFGGSRAKRLIPGHGAAVRPSLYRSDMADNHIHVSDADCVIGCRRLVRKEGILAGGSSGAVIKAVEQARHMMRPGAVCVGILGDRGERYLDTIYSDEWVERHFGDISHHWDDKVVELATS